MSSHLPAETRNPVLNPPSSPEELAADPHARSIKARVVLTLCMYHVPDDPAIARGLALQFVRILYPFTLAEIDAACTRYEGDHDTKAPNPAAIRKIIEAERWEETMRIREAAREKQEREEWEAYERRRAARPSPERVRQILREQGWRPPPDFNSTGETDERQ